MSFQRVCCWFAEAFDLGILFGVEPCADVMVSAKARRRSPKYRGAAAGARRRWRKVFDLEDFDLGVLSGVKPCVNVSVSAAARRRPQNIWARRRGRGGKGAAV